MNFLFPRIIHPTAAPSAGPQYPNREPNRQPAACRRLRLPSGQANDESRLEAKKKPVGRMGKALKAFSIAFRAFLSWRGRRDLNPRTLFGRLLP